MSKISNNFSCLLQVLGFFKLSKMKAQISYFPTFWVQLNPSKEVVLDAHYLKPVTYCKNWFGVSLSPILHPLPRAPLLKSRTMPSLSRRRNLFKAPSYQSYPFLATSSQLLHLRFLNCSTLKINW